MNIDDFNLTIMSTMTEKLNVKPVKAGWYNLFRPWALHGAIVPVLIGGLIAFDNDINNIPVNAENISLLILTIIGAVLFQSAANIFNTYGDFVKGIDTEENEERSPELVKGLMTERQVFCAGAACIVIACLIGLIFISHVGWWMMIYGVSGIFGSVMYTLGVAYKYHALGQPFCFIMFGILMPQGAHYVLTGQLFSLDVFLIALPNAFTITAVLAGNELRDYYDDKKFNIKTLTTCMSYENGMRAYLFLSTISFAILVIIVVLGYAPLGSLIALLSLYDLYLLIKNSKNAHVDKHASFMLVPLCFRLNWRFGMFLMVGYIIQKALCC